MKHLSADSEKTLQCFLLRCRIGECLEALMESLPTFSDRDLQVVHRKTEKGVWKDELWTKRDFEPQELMLAPVSSQLKETNLMAAAHAVVALPKQGKGSHPDSTSLALDGRGRTSMAQKGSIDPEEHLGSFFWVVGRTSQQKEANMVMENVCFESTCKVSLPGPKRRKTSPVQRDSHEMPVLPVLMNKKALPKHTKLLVFLPEKKKDASPKSKESQ